MVKKSMRSPFVLLLVAFFVFFLCQEASVCFAVPYSHTAELTVTLSISSSGITSCTGLIRPSSSDTKSSVTVRLKQLVGANWITVSSATWYGSGTGLAGASAKGTKSVTKGYSYKVVITGTISDLNGNALETTTKETSVKVY